MANAQERDPLAAVPVRPAKGMPYLRFLRLMHMHLKPDWYLEIGTESGKSLKRAPGKAIAIDPDFRVKHDVIGDRPALHMFRQTSDDFFASGVVEKLTPRIDFAFLDGMHQVEFLLRDFMNVELHCGPDSVIAMHDVVPLTWLAAEREWDRDKTASWTGDVWKIVPILRRYRPDLTVVVADCAPTGLCLVTGLDPANRALYEKYDEIVRDFVPMGIEDFGVGALEASLSQTGATSPEMARYIGDDRVRSVATPAVIPERQIAIRLQAPNARRARRWGEFHLAEGLRTAFARRGKAAEVQPRDQWDRVGKGQVDLLIWGLAQDLELPADRPVLPWLLFNPPALSPDLTDRAAHLFVASRPEADRLASDLGSNNVSPLLQAFDADRMSAKGPAIRHRALFAGNGRQRSMRKTVRLALEQGVDIDLIGQRWTDTPAERFLAADYVANAELPAHYRGSQVVLNDHKFGMGRQGFVSNRIFDVLACGAPIVSDPVAGLPEELAPYIDVYDTDDAFAETVRKALSEGATRRAERRSFAEVMRELHSLDQRAARILEVLE